jgi:hypothetical protein
MDHFIVGMLVWGLLFAIYDTVAARPAGWLKGGIFGVFAWLMMMVTFMPLAGAGFFGAKTEISTRLGLLLLHLIYGIILGVTYDLLGKWFPVRLPVKPVAEALTDADTDKLVRMRASDYSFNDDLPSSSPSGKTLLLIFGGLAGFFVLIMLAVAFRSTLGI